EQSALFQVLQLLAHVVHIDVEPETLQHAGQRDVIQAMLLLLVVFVHEFEDYSSQSALMLGRKAHCAVPVLCFFNSSRISVLCRARWFSVSSCSRARWSSFSTSAFTPCASCSF